MWQDNGLLGAAELYGALLWLETPSVTPQGVLDLLDVGDVDRDGFLSYDEFSGLLKQPGEKNAHDEEEEEDGEERRTSSEKKALPPKVEPYGAEILRELSLERKRDELARKQKEKGRRTAFALALDAKVYQDELLASQSRATGANPELSARVIFPIENAPRLYRVQGAGVSIANGVYAMAGHKDWVPFFKHVGSDLVIMRETGLTSWCIKHELDKTAEGVLYRCQTPVSTDTPPFGCEWKVDMGGELPLPTVELQDLTTTTTTGGDDQLDTDNEASLRQATFKFTRADMPVRTVSTEKPEFSPVRLSGVFVESTEGRPLEQMKCNAGHDLKRGHKFGRCDQCKSRQSSPEMICYQCEDGFGVCRQCYQKFEQAQKRVTCLCQPSLK